VITPDDLARFLEASANSVRPRLESDLAKIGELTATMAAEYIGHEMPEWPPLAASTIAEKESLGYTGQVSPTDPLLRTGEMRDSIKVEVEGLEMAVGSTDPVALWQEIGTDGRDGKGAIPPRPFLALAGLRSLEYAADKLGETALALLVPGAKK
jgi:phage gpG-like protein